MSATVESELLQGLNRHEAWLRTALLARLGSREEVDEVMQELAVAVVQQAARPETVERVGPWLYRVALRQVMLFRRKTGRRRRLIQSVHDKTPLSNLFEPSPLQFLLAEERRELVRRAVAQLPELDRQLLMLKYVDGLSYGQIASRLGVSAGAVQSRLHRARPRLRRMLTPNPNFGSPSE